MAVNVLFAVYGALRDGNQDRTEAASVIGPLQRAIDSRVGEVVRIDNTTMGRDPAPGVTKHFGALVDVHGTRRAFACQEGQTIDFT
ncbi:hypothetical protein SAMN05660690_4438 [Geodermatophilus telluris]|uniref:Uncharacterized protein n=1 Tax=Geodermatophilus telluris TaxID=1190417 RepID=A0A1G6VDI4_9ACTN|nr:hypothetical protein [Geodermatophilus telluris]SDD50876.1 hypothetical protein SAMN05660690_4438 [Geodermatophilus telluris]